MNFNLPISPYPCMITAHLPQCATMLDGVKSKENMYRKKNLNGYHIELGVSFVPGPNGEKCSEQRF